ncbi:uncharacterized protein [Lolium perenne]|jgi:hypothetical protein|uniref:uncharacterized protein n=1 Tax=Lolium perenne TaxID=4522 RepID=UPI0021EAF4D9|nr:uncharacterized protein LOC127338051 [Lolium perenne]
MARLTFFAVHAPVAAAAAHPLPVVFLVVLVVAAVVVSLCTSSTHAKLWKQRGTTTAPLEKTGVAGNRKNMLAASLSGIGGKAARMVSWNRRSPAPSSSDDDEEAEAVVEDEEAVWRKAIIMGDKCRPLQFSGHIAFDSDGNQLPPVVKKADVAAEK